MTLLTGFCQGAPHTPQRHQSGPHLSRSITAVHMRVACVREAAAAVCVGCSKCQLETFQNYCTDSGSFWAMQLKSTAWVLKEGMTTAEKNLEALKGILERLPSNACLCFVGDGPSRPDLAKHFEGLPVYFTVSRASL